MSVTSEDEFGAQLRRWRQSRHLSQLALSVESGVSSRHLSFIETGRAQPSRDMVLLLAARLGLSLREQNALLLAAGFAPVFKEHAIDAPELQAVRDAVELVLQNHEPFPAFAVDGAWNIVRSNCAASLLVDGVSQALLVPPMNVYRVSLHPDGMRARVSNFDAYAAAMVSQLRREANASGRADLMALLREVEGYPGIRALPRPTLETTDVTIPLRLRTPDGELAFITTIATFGTPLNVTVAELAIESFFPANAATAALIRSRANRAK